MEVDVSYRTFVTSSREVDVCCWFAFLLVPRNRDGPRACIEEEGIKRK